MPSVKKSRPAYGDPRRPESVGVSRSLERKKIGEWLCRWANVRLRGDFRAIDKHAAQVVLKLGSYVKTKAGDLGDIGDLGWKEARRVKRKAARAAKRSSLQQGD